MRQSQITDWTRSLITTLGRPRAPISLDPLKRLHAKKDYDGMWRAVRSQLKLDMRLRAGYVDSGGPSNAPAWIPPHLPIPMYGTREFREYKLTVFLRKDFLARAPCGAVAVAMAHEMAHVVLDSTRNSLREQEEAVDLTAMLFGFRETFLLHSAYESKREIAQPKPDGIVEHVRRLLEGSEPEILVTNHHVGYLTHEERAYANWVMERWP